MPLQCGKSGKRSDAKHMASCGEYTRYYCRIYGSNCLRHNNLKCKFRNKIYKEALKFGENLMPNDVIEIINKILPDTSFNTTLLIDIYTSCGFELSYDEAREYII